MGIAGMLDQMGRAAIHYAAMQRLENLQQIASSGADIDAKDSMGMSVMHWAVVSGSLEVVERVLSLSRCLLDQPDTDGRTPLLWAARGCVTAHKKTAAHAQEKIITFLLDQGADVMVKGQGLDRIWTPIQVARYHSCDDEVIELLVKKTKAELGKVELYIEEEHASLKAYNPIDSCDSCHCCYNSRLVIHNKDHTFDIIGPEFEVAVDVEKESTGDDDEDSDDGTDDGTNDDGDK